MIKVKFFNEASSELVKSEDDSSPAVIAIYYEDRPVDDSWECERLPAIVDTLNSLTRIAASKISFVTEPNPDLAVVEDVIRMMKTGVVIEAPEVIIDPNVVY